MDFLAFELPVKKPEFSLPLETSLRLLLVVSICCAQPVHQAAFCLAFKRQCSANLAGQIPKTRKAGLRAIG